MGERNNVLPGDLVVVGSRYAYRDVLFMKHLDIRRPFALTRSVKDEICIIVSDSTAVDDPRHLYRLVLWDGNVAWVNEVSIKAVM